MPSQAPLLALALAVVAPSGVRAELPPQYTRWDDLATILEQVSIPQTIGVVDSIEAIEDGTYKVRAGTCHVIANVSRRGQPPAPDGSIMVGPSIIAGVEIGDPICE